MQADRAFAVKIENLEARLLIAPTQHQTNQNFVTWQVFFDPSGPRSGSAAPSLPPLGRLARAFNRGRAPATIL
jgi:hypothetical protein